jgi:hypothetical protein
VASKASYSPPSSITEASEDDESTVQDAHVIAFLDQYFAEPKSFGQWKNVHKYYLKWCDKSNHPHCSRSAFDRIRKGAKNPRYHIFASLSLLHSFTKDFLKRRYRKSVEVKKNLKRAGSVSTRSSFANDDFGYDDDNDDEIAHPPAHALNPMEKSGHPVVTSSGSHVMATAAPPSNTFEDQIKMLLDAAVQSKNEYAALAKQLQDEKQQQEARAKLMKDEILSEFKAALQSSPGLKFLLL